MSYQVVVPIRVGRCAFLQRQKRADGHHHAGTSSVMCGVRFLPAPVVVSKSKGLPSQKPPTLPPFARNSGIVWQFQSFIAAIRILSATFLILTSVQNTHERSVVPASSRVAMAREPLDQPSRFGLTSAPRRASTSSVVATTQDGQLLSRLAKHVLCTPSKKFNAALRSRSITSPQAKH